MQETEEDDVIHALVCLFTNLNLKRMSGFFSGTVKKISVKQTTDKFTLLSVVLSDACWFHLLLGAT